MVEFVKFVEFKKGYPARTEENIKTTDGTLIFAINLFTPGEKLTINLLKKYKTPYLIVKINKKENKEDNLFTHFKSSVIDEWIIENNISKLNIAGNCLDRFNCSQDILDSFLFKYLSECKILKNM